MWISNPDYASAKFAIEARQRYLRERIATDEDPRRYGEPLRRNLAGRWKYRVRAYRLICDIQDEKVLVLVLMVGHRSKIYGGH